MIVSALRVEVFISFLVYYFTISFLTVIWAIVAFIDNNIMNITAFKPASTFLGLPNHANFIP
jgi:hypothetical protein